MNESVNQLYYKYLPSKCVYLIYTLLISLYFKRFFNNEAMMATCAKALSLVAHCVVTHSLRQG